VSGQTAGFKKEKKKKNRRKRVEDPEKPKEAQERKLVGPIGGIENHLKRGKEFQTNEKRSAGIYSSKTGKGRVHVRELTPTKWRMKKNIGRGVWGKAKKQKLKGYLKGPPPREKRIVVQKISEVEERGPVLGK